MNLMYINKCLATISVKGYRKKYSVFTVYIGFSSLEISNSIQVKTAKIIQ